MAALCAAVFPRNGDRKENAVFGDIIVIGVIGLCAGLALRSMHKDHKEGNHCGGSCASCGRCCHKKAE